jgi:hypothetical protein
MVFLLLMTFVACYHMLGVYTGSSLPPKTALPTFVTCIHADDAPFPLPGNPTVVAIGGERASVGEGRPHDWPRNPTLTGGEASRNDLPSRIRVRTKASAAPIVRLL